MVDLSSELLQRFKDYTYSEIEMLKSFVFDDNTNYNYLQLHGTIFGLFVMDARKGQTPSKWKSFVFTNNMNDYYQISNYMGCCRL